jgi:uncharacterized protein with PQ loop repeat
MQSAVPFLSLMAYIPQWRKIVTRKSSKDVSLAAWLLWIVTASIAVFYAVVQLMVTGQGLALVFSSSVTLLFVATTFILVFVYRAGRSTA